MFYYYGAKHRLSKTYTPPAHEWIIEPFAGAAGYACYWAEKRPGQHRFLLVEKDPRVLDAWERVLRGDLPTMPPAGEHTDDFLLMTCQASNATGKAKLMKVSPRSVRAYEMMVRRIERIRPFLIGRVHLRQGDYTDIKNTTPGTYFIDPPYWAAPGSRSDSNGNGYAAGCDARSLDYEALGAWSQTRLGQVIVCEQEGATWLPFKPLQPTKAGLSRDTLGKPSKEVYWESDTP